MKVTKEQLKQLIREEISQLDEIRPPGAGLSGAEESAREAIMNSPYKQIAPLIKELVAMMPDDETKFQALNLVSMAMGQG